MAELGKVLVLSASAGAGHLRAAQAVERALIGMAAVREVRHNLPRERDARAAPR